MYPEVVEHLINGPKASSFTEARAMLQEIADITEKQWKPPDDSKLWPRWFRAQGIWTIPTQDLVDSLYAEME